MRVVVQRDEFVVVGRYDAGQWGGVGGCSAHVGREDAQSFGGRDGLEDGGC